MSKRIKILVAVVSAVVLLVIIGTVTVMAQSPTPTPTTAPTTPVTPPARPNINAQVAKILGITETQLNDAMKQAKMSLVTPSAPTTPATPATPVKPMRPVPFTQADMFAKVAQILNDQKITQGMTGDKIAAAFQQAEKEMRDQAINNALDNAVKNGKISQDEQNQIKKWYQDRPAALDKLGMPFGPGPGMRPGFGPMPPDIKGKMNNFENRLKGLQDQFKNFKNRMNGGMPKTPPPSAPATGT